MVLLSLTVLKLNDLFGHHVYITVVLPETIYKIFNLNSIYLNKGLISGSILTDLYIMIMSMGSG